MKLKYAATGLAVVLALAGCQRTSYNPYQSSAQSLPPLQAQPVPTVQSGQLPDPTMTAPGQFPAAPASAAATATDVVPATAQDVTKESMVGNWRVASAGSNCDMFLTLTNLGSGSRGGTRGCTGELTGMGAWEVAGKQVLLKDRNGNTIGRLYKTAEARFDGTTNAGQPVSLSR